MKTVTDMFEPYIGTREYNGIVGDIQRWYYECDDIVRASWCSTSMSYFLNKLGLLSKIGKKQENVYQMMKMCESAAKKGTGTFYYRNDIPQNFNILRGTIIFMLNSDPPMTETSSKHVTSMYENTKWKGSGNWKGLGGNQSDMIRVSQYTQAKIYAIYIPDYTDEKPVDTLRRGSKGDDVRALQKDLNVLGSTDNDGEMLVLDGSFGRKTEESVKKFQKENSLVVDGIVGKQTFGKINELKSKYIGKTATVKTLLNVRSGPSATYKIKKVVPEGYKDTITRINLQKTWAKFKMADGWVNIKYIDF